MSKRSEASVPLLKTCQTCFHAKIRCDKTQDSGLCDRCLRLGKTCIFAPARRRYAGRRSDKREGGPLGASRSPSITPTRGTISAIDGLDTPLNSLISQGGLSLENSFNPFNRELLTYEKGQELLDNFRSKMTPYFPFVVVPEEITVQELARTKPSLCLAILSAASNADIKLQRRLAILFNELIAILMITGKFTTIEVLQGLLVHLAWAHFLPRPRRYSQHLHLANSIVSDLRLDKPRKPNFWGIDTKQHKSEPDWSNEEKRALAGLYYLASSTSVLLQKSRHFIYTPYVFECCQFLAAQEEYRSDKYLPYIIHLQKLTEDVDDIVTKSPNEPSVQQTTVGLQTVRERYTAVKSTLPFSLSDSPTILLQLNLLDLLISQSDSDGTPFGMNKFQNIEKTVADQSRLLDWLSQSISASKSLISVVLVLPHGEEGALPNIGWIMMYCGVSLAARLDLLAAHTSISPITQHLRRILDMPHTLRQIVLRLEAASSKEADPDGEWDPFFHFARRGRRIEEWYLQNCKRNEQGESVDPFTPAPSTAQQTHSSTGVTPVPYLASNEVPSIEITSEPNDFWAPNFMNDLGAEFDLSSALFTESFDFFNNHQF